MNEHSTQDSDDAAIAARQQTLNRQQTQAGIAQLAVTVVTLFILPKYLASPYDGIAMGFGSAAILTVFLYLHPAPFRSRSGSLVPAVWLVVALWLLAVVTTAVTLLG